MINDYKETHSVVDCQKWGTMRILDTWETSAEHRGYQLKEDAIHIFLNFKKIAVARSRSEAVSIVRRLVEECPSEFQSDFDEYSEILFRSMRD